MTDCPFCGGCGKEDCDACEGTGIGQHGDPDTSKCTDCAGRGWNPCSCVKEEREAEAYDRFKDFRKERKLERFLSGR